MHLLSLGDLIARWGELYRNHAALQSGVAFFHIGGLVGSGGMALAADRAILRAGREDDAGRSIRLRDLRGTHRPVMIGLSLVFASGFLFFLADLDTFLGSKVFWIKMALVGTLLFNGLLMLRAETAVERDPRSELGWRRLRHRATASLALWALIVLAGATLVNVQ